MKRLMNLAERAGLAKERVLRRLAPWRMRVYPITWPLRADICPCDVHLCEYLLERQIRGRSLFHFGTGGHHVVGWRNFEAGLDNDILGITASPGEHARYVRDLIRRPELGRRYKVLFADIYEIGAALLPPFDLVALFHLGEFTPPPGGGRLDDAALLELFLEKLRSGGRLLLYDGSFGRPLTRPLVDAAVSSGKLVFEETYRSLSIYRRTG